MLTDNSTDVQKCTSVYIYDTPMLPCQLHVIDNCTIDRTKRTPGKNILHKFNPIIPGR